MLQDNLIRLEALLWNNPRNNYKQEKSLTFFFFQYLDCPIKKHVLVTEFCLNRKIIGLVLYGTSSALQGSIAIAVIVLSDGSSDIIAKAVQ